MRFLRKPKPFVCTAKTNDILQKVIRANRRLGSKNYHPLHIVDLIAQPAARGERLARDGWCANAVRSVGVLSGFGAAEKLHEDAVDQVVADASVLEECLAG